MDVELAGKAFIVTGGTDGLGLASVKALVAEGANVLVTGRIEDRFARACTKLGDRGNRIAFLSGDTASSDLPGQLRTAIFERSGRLDGLLASVGGPPAGRRWHRRRDLARGVRADLPGDRAAGAGSRTRDFRRRRHCHRACGVGEGSTACAADLERPTPRLGHAGKEFCRRARPPAHSGQHVAPQLVRHRSRAASPWRR